MGPDERGLFSVFGLVFLRRRSLGWNKVKMGLSSLGRRSYWGSFPW